MATLERSITINAPVEKVFGYVSEPTNLPEIWPSFVEAKNVQRLPNGGYSFSWLYKMGGVRFEGTSEDAEYVVNQRIVAKTQGGIGSTVTWRFQPENSGTRVTVKAEYTIPVPVLGKLAEAFVVKLNEREAELVLANLKTRMET